ncbi:MAG TPA: hypothetical protein EYN67_06880 [Flavobacteriales bacterium]|nr:hypothetical protein [Flavobacteriales bacterium]
MITINKEKLEQVILNEMSDLENGPFLDCTVCIGSIDGLQVHVKVTKEEEEFISHNGKFICVLDGNKSPVEQGY